MCEYCEGNVYIHDDWTWMIDIINGKLHIEIEDDVWNYYDSIEMNIKYCPECGEKLNDD